MIFQTKLFSATWDTWMYYENGIYYLYYLITEKSPGEGFGVAVSIDGVHFEDCGKQLQASDKMVFYLGTGSVWKKRPWDGTYLCNYSEWREKDGKRTQQIFFANSSDLIHWEKYDEKESLVLDSNYYETDEEKAARWDCINPLETENGYYGYWTARPKNRTGIGFGFSENGLNWKVLPPPMIDTTCFGNSELESGSIVHINNKYYTLIGNYGHESGVKVFVADAPDGPFVPQQRSQSLFANQKRVHAYFARTFDTPDEILVNYHVLLRETNEYNRPYTYLAPIKKVDVDEHGIFRLKWWGNNDILIGREMSDVDDSCMICADIHDNTTIVLKHTNGKETHIVVNNINMSAIVKDDYEYAEICRAIACTKRKSKLKILLYNTLVEIYLDDYYLLNYTLSEKVECVFSKCKMKYYELKLP